MPTLLDVDGGFELEARDLVGPAFAGEDHLEVPRALGEGGSAGDLVARHAVDVGIADVAAGDILELAEGLAGGDELPELFVGDVRCGVGTGGGKVAPVHR